MFRSWLVISLGLILTGFVVACAAVSPPSSDTKSWKTYRVEISGQITQFSIPPDESSDFPNFEIPQYIDVAQRGICNEAHIGPKLLNRFWDYKINRLSPVDGTLHAYIVLWCSEKEISNSGALQVAVEENQKLIIIRGLTEGGNGGPVDKMRFETKSFSGKTALLVTHQITSPNYVVLLSPYYYLTISIDIGSVRNPELRTMAKTTADAILNSIHIEPKN